jgi:hypothetical protein
MAALQTTPASFLPGRPPRALPPRKARTAAECDTLEQLPNIGPSIAADLRSIGVAHPRELADKDAAGAVPASCAATTGKRQDPCVLDTFMAATEFHAGRRSPGLGGLIPRCANSGTAGAIGTNRQPPRVWAG